MASLTFNEFQKELRNRNIEGPTAVMLTIMYEQQCELATQMDMCAKVLTQLVETVANFADLHEATQGRLSDLKARMYSEESVKSVPITDEGDYKQ